jgi:TetR/AcrR family transcriptional regulator, repressor for neighboring sulfatase
MHDDKTKPPPGGREATIAAIIDAAEELFAARGYDAVSVREIAERAGVSHALVHRYLGSKADIYRGILESNARSMLAAAPDDPDLLATVSLMLRDGLAQHRRYLRLVMHSAVRGVPISWPADMFGATERLVELAEGAAASASPEEVADRRLDPRLAVAFVVALTVAWSVLEPLLLARTGIDDMDEDAIVDALERVVLGILKENTPGVDDSRP